MTSSIYLLRENDEPVRLSEQEYDSEALLQRLLADHPALLAGDEIDRQAPRKWLLVSREAALPSEEEGGGRWSVDHLFLDQDGIPTLIEVKRSADTRIRREVIGQMLEYAANAVAYWPIETIRGQFEATWRERDTDPDQKLQDFLGVEASPDEFWGRVKTNLQAAKLRIMLVADAIPDETRRIVEFLNEQMDPSEILAVEIPQYVGEGFKTLVPRVIGRTAGAERRKSTGGGEKRTWDETSFFVELERRRGAEEAKAGCAIFEWAKTALPRFTWGHGLRSGSFFPVLDHKNEEYWPIGMWTFGSVEIQFQWLKERSPFDSEDKRLEFLRRLNEIPGVSIPPDAITRRPSIALSILTNEDTQAHFFAVLGWAIDQIKAV